MTDGASRCDVLVVEDDDSIATALEYVMMREGLTHDRVSSGADALLRIRVTKPQLVLLDVMLPEVSGYDICRDLRIDPELTGTKVLMMTARGSTLERDKAIAAGADAFIAKPFDLKMLRGEVRRLLATTGASRPTP
jgi:two-component system, OmpR family, phosphate regulon response regulator PhoB